MLKPQAQFPLRIDAELMEKFDEISKSTRIPKSTLARIALEKFLNEIEKSNIAKSINSVIGD
jgi:predicted DNA-binding protein